MGILKVAFVSIVGFSIVGGCISAMSPKTPTAPDSPEVVAAKAISEKHFQEVVRVAKSLKSSAKNPASFELASAFRTADGTLCLSYRATNSFNAVVPGYAAATKGRIETGAAPWNSRCANKTGEDFSYARLAI
jgi:hypothetical protein